MARRTHSPEFKREAVRLARDLKVPKAQVAKDLGIHPNLLKRWTQQYEQDAAHAFPGRGHMKPADAEMVRLKRELMRVTAERDILKKALGYFAKEPK